MKRFIVLDPFGGLLEETDDVNAAQGHARRGQYVACHVEPEALKALVAFISEAGDNVGARLRRRQWKAERIAIDPTCAFCRKDLTLSSATIDHLVPLAEGGVDDESNWELSCQKCNSEKGRLSVGEFLERVTSARVFREWLASREPAAA
jgi:hypothetical protein